MGDKRTRKKRTSSGARKHNLSLRNSLGIGKDKRRGRAIANQPHSNFIRHQAENRWPTEESKQKAFEMLKDKKSRRPARKNIKPAQTGFTLLDMIIDKASTQTLLVAASLKLKKVRRYPGYVLIRTYNLKSRVIEII